MSDKNKEIVEKVNASFERGDTEGFLAFCADDIEWTMVGEKNTSGKESIREWMKQMEGFEPPMFTVNSLIADADFVACSGDMTMKEKDGSTGEYGYCDIYRFSGDKIQELTSYVVKTNKADKNLEASA